MKINHLVIFVFFLPVIFLINGCIIYPELVETGMKSPKTEKCGDCHIDIYKEWNNSPHAGSYTSNSFKEETFDYSFTFCIGCHSPKTIFTNGNIEPRDIHVEEGVNCNGCHLNDCTLAGPTPARAPHPFAEKDMFYKTSELCGKCHIGTYTTWQEIKGMDEKKTCQDCHMPKIFRKLIQDEPWQKIYPKREGKRHLFSYQDLIPVDEDHLLLSFANIVQSESTIEGALEITNAGIPHSIPTGDYGYREVLVKIELLNKTGQVVDARETSLFVELKTALNYGEKRIIQFDFILKENVSSIRAQMLRTSLERDTSFILAEKIYGHL
ncbi:MAG: hypothetical protein FJ264_12125 [Planctomycetes bacterium]|nr:hypothetical protein [Planctomycetota bacterium]